nr:EamA family transporter [Lysobacter profundi]
MADPAARGDRNVATTQWLLWASLSAGFAALTAIFAKAGLVGVDSDFATLLRTFVIVALLAAFVLATGKWRNPASLSPRTLGFLVASAMATGASWVCYFRALKIGPASKVAAVDKMSLLLVAIFAFVFLGERLLAREWLGVALIGIGVVVLAIKS